jgi:hypothetical protein
MAYMAYNANPANTFMILNGEFMADLTRYVDMLVETNSKSVVTGYRVRSVNQNSDFDFNFVIPNDFVSLNSFLLVGWPTVVGLANATFDLTSNYGRIAEPLSNHSESLTTPPYDLSNPGIKLGINIAPVFTQLLAGDSFGLNVLLNSVGTTMEFEYIHLSYQIG